MGELLVRCWNRHPLPMAVAGRIAFMLFTLLQSGFYSGRFNFHDPDTLMRLVLARDMHAHGWRRELHFMRLDPPLGMSPHWSSLFEWTILGAASLLWFLPFDQALAVAGFYTGPTLDILVMLVAFWAVRPVLPSTLCAVFSLAIVFGAVAGGYDRPGMANHHSILLLMTIVLMGTAIRCDRNEATSRLMALAGLSAGLGLWISFEALPLVELFWGYLAILWIADSRPRHVSLLLFTTVFCGVSMAALAIDPPEAGYGSGELDRISLPYVFGIALQLGAVLALAVCPARPVMRLAWLAVLCLASAIAEILIFPAMVAGPQAQIDPFVRSEWLANIQEMRPVYTVTGIILYIGNGLIGLACLARLPVRPSWKRYIWLAGLALLCSLALRYVRASPYVWMAGSLAALAALHHARQASVASRRVLWNVLTPYLAAGLVLGCLSIGKMLFDRQYSKQIASLANCSYDAVLPALNDRSFLHTGEAAPVFVTELDKSPALLFNTGYRALAGNYHTDALGIDDSYLMMRDFGWTTARSVVDDHHISYFLLCPTSDRDRYGTTNVTQYWKEFSSGHHLRQPTFYTRIMDGTLPPWLVQRQWPDGVRTDLKLFQVVSPPP